MSDVTPGTVRILNRRFRLEALIGRGSFGVVYEALDLAHPSQPIAVKVLATRSRDSVLRLGEEFRALAGLSHPNIAQVLEFGVDQETGEPFYTMDRLRGADFVTAARGLPGEELLELVAQGLRALAYLHSRDWVHGDVKPANLLVCDREPDEGVPALDRVKLLDFGLARVRAGPEPGRPPGSSPGGTALYLAPELVGGSAPSPFSDLYSFGALAYHAACGQPPFRGSFEEILKAHVSQAPRPPRAILKTVPEALEAILLRLLAKEPEDRYASAREALQALARFSGRDLPVETPQSRARRLHLGPFVGRGPEMQILQNQLDLLVMGRGRSGLVLVTGEAGIGKTRLVREFCHHMQIYGVEVLRVSCPRESRATLRPLIEPFRRLFCTAPEAVQDAYLADVSRLIPGLVCPVIPPGGRPAAPEELDPEPPADPPEPGGPPAEPDRPGPAGEDVRRRTLLDSPLLERLVRFLLARARSPVALVLDDLQWADEGTLDLIHALAPRAARGRILVVGILRGTEGATPSRRRKRLDSIDPLEVTLGPLADGEIQELARGLSATGTLDPELTRSIAAAVGGNPFFAEEVLRLHEEAGEAAGALPMPESIARAMRGRLSRLPAASRTAAEALGAFDRPVSTHALAGVLDRPPDEVARALVDLVSRRLVRTVEELPGHHALVQPAFGELLAQESDPADRRRLHGRIAQHLTVLAAEGREHLHEEVAFHFRAAGMPERCLEHTLLAARRCDRIFDHEGARQLFEEALGLIEEDEHASRLTLEQEIAAAAEASGDVESALEHLARARALAVALGRRGSEVTILGEMGRIHLSRGEPVEARRSLDQGLEMIELPGLVREYVDLVDLQARACLDAADAGRALTFCEKGQRELEAQGHEPDAALTYTTGCALSIQGRGKEALEAWAQAADRARSQDAPLVQMRSLLSMSSELLEFGELQRAAVSAREALGIASLRRDVPRQVSAHVLLAELALAQGDLGTARAHLDQSRDLAQKMGYRGLVHATLNVQANLDLLRGRLADAVEVLWKTFQGHRKSLPEEGFGQTFREHAMGRAYFAIGDSRKAWSFLSRARRRVDSMQAPGLRGYVLHTCGRLGIREQRLARAEADLREAAGLFMRSNHRFPLAQVHLALAELHLTREESGRAREAAERALAFAQEAGAQPILIGAQVLLGRILDQRGDDPDRARDLLGTAQARSLALGLPDLVVRAGLALGQLHRRRGEDGEAREAYRHAVLALREMLAPMRPEQAAAFSADPDRSRLLAEWASFRDAGPAAGTPGERLALPRGEELMDAIGRINESLSTDPTETLKLLVEVGLSLSGAERGAIITAGPEGTLAVSLARDAAGEELHPRTFLYSKTMVEQALRERRPLQANDTSHTEPLSPSASVLSLDLKSVLALPLTWREHLSGLLYLDSHAVTRHFSSLDFQLLSLFARHAAVALANHRYFRENEELRSRLQSENLYLREEIRQASHFSDVVGDGPAIQKALLAVEKVAPTDTTVLVRGETGTGKELFARAVHSRSARASKPLIKVNVAALPADLIESELFGHEKGAFTGAAQRRIGRFELAHGGTIFLDEIGDLPPPVQVKLLRVLQEKEFERLGSSRTIPSDCRVIAATNRNLEDMIARGQFREDLFYRLNVFPIPLPPLRERGSDILRIAAHLIARFQKTVGKKVTGIDEATRRRLLAYHWPGNVRELSNVIERAMILAGGEILTADTLGDAVGPPSPESALEFPEGGISLTRTLHELKLNLIREALRRANGNQAQAARLLGLQRSNLNRLLRSAPPAGM